MKFAMTKIAASVVLAAAALSAQAATLTVTSMSITGGKFGMGAPAPDACNGGAFGSFQCIAPGNSNPIDTDDGLFEGPTLTSFNFFNSPVTTFTAASAAGAANSTSGNPLMGTADDVAGTISIDLGSFYASWNGNNFLQAPGDVNGPLNPVVTGTYDAGTGAFALSWSSYITTAPFDTQTGYWDITGTVTTAPIPEASTYGMMLAGLGLVGGMVARRRKLMA